MKRSGMIQPSPDSRRSITQPLLSQRTSVGTSSQAKKQTNAPSSYSYSVSENKQEIYQKRGPSAANSELNTNAKEVDLAQDSDEENAKVKKIQKRMTSKFFF
jgi:hypothetical protein